MNSTSELQNQGWKPRELRYWNINPQYNMGQVSKQKKKRKGEKKNQKKKKKRLANFLL